MEVGRGLDPEDVVVYDLPDRGEGLKRLAVGMRRARRVVDEPVTRREPSRRRLIAVPELGETALDTAEDVGAGDNADPIASDPPSVAAVDPGSAPIR